jgi:hypothetical protein
MNELVQLVSDKTGIPEAQARTAVETVLGYLKDRVPAPIAGQIDNVVQGGSGGSAGDLAEGLGGMLNKK